MFPRRIAENHRVSLNLGGGVGITDMIDAGLQIQRHGILHHGEVLIANGKRLGWMREHFSGKPRGNVPTQ